MAGDCEGGRLRYHARIDTIPIIDANDLHCVSSIYHQCCPTHVAAHGGREEQDCIRDFLNLGRTPDGRHLELGIHRAGLNLRADNGSVYKSKKWSVIYSLIVHGHEYPGQIALIRIPCREYAFAS